MFVSSRLEIQLTPVVVEVLEGVPDDAFGEDNLVVEKRPELNIASVLRERSPVLPDEHHQVFRQAVRYFDGRSARTWWIPTSSCGSEVRVDMEL